jgi:tetratricopeptide (TPR) repeat protein
MAMKFGLVFAVVAGTLAQAQIENTPAQDAPRPYVRMTGRIVLQDGSVAPAPPRVISRDCPIDMQGWSSFTIAYPASMDVNSAAHLESCWIEVSLPGYRSVRTQVHDGIVVVLKRLGEDEGSTVSLSVLKAPEKARKVYEKGGQEVYRKKWPQAQANFEEAVRIYPEYASAWDELGLVLEKQNKRDEAAEAYRKASAADPKYIRPYVHLAGLAIDEQRWQDAFDQTSRAMELNPIEFPAAYYYRALAAFNLKQLDEAERNTRRAIDRDVDQQLTRAKTLLDSILAAKIAQRAGS